MPRPCSCARVVSVLAMILVVAAPACSGEAARAATPLFNGWSLSPAGDLIALPGDMPLAIRFLGGPDSAAIVTIDDGHIGSAEQSRSLGRMLGVPSYRFATAEAFADASRCVAAQELVLIDTPALSGDDAEVRALAAGLAEACPTLSSMLVLPASFQAGVLEEAVRRAAPFAPRCCAVTRFDEAVSLGGLLSTVVRSQLPLALVSDGPRIPEDLRAARAHQLVARAAELARDDRAHADEDLLGRRFGGYVHAAA